MKKHILTLLFLILLIPAFSQVAVNADGSDADGSAMLDVKSTSAGVLVPRMTLSERNSIGSPATGLMVFQSDDISGFYYYNGSEWDMIGNKIVPDTTEAIPIKYHGTYRYVYPIDNATDVNYITAQTTCSDLDELGYDDWYLPSISELNAMYKQSYLITGLEENDSYKYWSNTEVDGSYAYTLRLDYGAPDPDDKDSPAGHKVRCIRKD
jgi:hypothetical protein